MGTGACSYSVSACVLHDNRMAPMRSALIKRSVADAASPRLTLIESFIDSFIESVHHASKSPDTGDTKGAR